jgi:hypothetical protein
MNEVYRPEAELKNSHFEDIYLKGPRDHNPLLPLLRLLLSSYSNNIAEKLKVNLNILRLMDLFYRSFNGNLHQAFERGAFPLLKIRDIDQILEILQMIISGMPNQLFYQDLSFKDVNQWLEWLEWLPEYWSKLKQELTEKLTSLEKNKNGKPVIIISQTHETDQALMEILKDKGVDLSEIGIIVIDQHIDAFGNTKEEVPNKGNFLRYALRSGIGTVSIIGPNEKDIKAVTEENQIFR